jgi:hypothetical protein
VRRRKVAIPIAVSIAIVAAGWWIERHRVQPTPAPAVWSQDAYVWQRDWSAAVRESVRSQGPEFRSLFVLAGEISWPTPEGRVTEIRPDYRAAARDGAVGIAVRIGPLPRSTRPGPAQERLIVDTATRASAAAGAAGVTVSEIHLDCDCAESKLADYTGWVNAVKTAAAPVPVVITALPAWLKSPVFPALARAAGGFVIQVHSLHQPTGPDDPMSICNAAEARRAVESASHIGVPFRIALPTYGYTVAFKPDRTFLALSAEGPSPGWPPGTILREMRSDPAEIAALVRDWTAAPPPNCAGIIWYRLPVAGDRMNWPPATLRAGPGRHPAVPLPVRRRRPRLGGGRADARRLGGPGEVPVRSRVLDEGQGPEGGRQILQSVGPPVPVDRPGSAGGEAALVPAGAGRKMNHR